MKVYNVNVYTIHPYYTTINDKRTGNEYALVKKIDKIMVTKTLFGVKEIITRQPLLVYDHNYMDFDKKIQKYFLKYDIILGVNKNSLRPKNLAIASKLDEYKNNFVWSNFRKVIKVYNSQKEINERINKIKEKIK